MVGIWNYMKLYEVILDYIRLHIASYCGNKRAISDAISDIFRMASLLDAICLYCIDVG